MLYHKTIFRGVFMNCCTSLPFNLKRRNSHYVSWSYSICSDYSNLHKEVEFPSSHRPFSKIIKYMDIWNLPAFRKHMFLTEIYSGFGWHVSQFKLALFQNHHRNKVRTRRFDKWRLVMTFLTKLPIIFGVTRMLCSFRLVLQEKVGIEIHQSSKFEFLESFLETALFYKNQNTTLLIK